MGNHNWAVYPSDKHVWVTDIVYLTVAIRHRMAIERKQQERHTVKQKAQSQLSEKTERWV